MFADEAYIYLGQNGKIYVQRPVNQEFEEKYMAVVGPLKAKIGAWVAFSSHGTLPIELYQGTMNMVRLKAVFKKNLIRTAAAQFSGQPIRLLQGNAKYHIGHRHSSMVVQQRSRRGENTNIQPGSQSDGKYV